MTQFKGFPSDLIDFFNELEQSNNRSWFNASKDRYIESVSQPMSDFIVAMQPQLKAISPHYIADPKPHGGSMFRIYRDARFSKDKTPYKTHVACQFRHEAGKDVHAPGFYVHIGANEVFFGGGIWHPASKQLNRIRDFIADNVRAWARIRNAKRVLDVGGIKGESLLRPPRGFPAEHIHIDDLKRKSFYVMTESRPAAVLKPDLVERVSEAFSRAAPLNRFLCQALDLPF